MKKITLSLMIACFGTALTLSSCTKSEVRTVSQAKLNNLEQQLTGKWFGTNQSEPSQVPYLQLEGIAGVWPEPYKSAESFGWGKNVTKTSMGWYAYYDSRQDRNVLQTTYGTYTFSFIKAQSPDSTILGLSLVSDGGAVYNFNK